MSSQNLPLPTDERMLAIAWKAIMEGVAGRDLKDFLKQAVRQSLDDLRNWPEVGISAEAMIMRYQQRQGISDELLNHIQSLIDSLGGESTDGNDPDNPDSDDHSYSGTRSDS